MKPHAIIRPVVTIMTAIGLALAASAAPSAENASKLLSSYYEVQKGLAGDDLAAAQTAAKELAEMAEKLGAGATLQEAAVTVAKAAHINAARAAFQPLSNEMLALAESTGVEAEPAFVVRCPMAFSGKGGTWLQNSKTVANPYYGASMLRCGSVVKELDGRASAAKP